MKPKYRKKIRREGGEEFFWLARIYTPAKNFFN